MMIMLYKQHGGNTCSSATLLIIAVPHILKYLSCSGLGDRL